jgi:hypothetical protein
MSYTTQVRRASGALTIATFAALALAGTAAAAEDPDLGALRNGGVKVTEVDVGAARNGGVEFHKVDPVAARNGDVVLRRDDPGAAGNGGVEQIDVGALRNSIDTPLPAAPAADNEPTTVFIDDGSLEYLQISLAAAAGAAFTAAGIGAYAMRRQRTMHPA